jgi:WD40 repeat protein
MIKLYQNIKLFSSEFDVVDVVDCLLVLNDSKWLASGHRNFLINIWIIEKAWLITSLEGHTGYINSLVALRNGHMASSSKDMSIKVWNYDNLEYGAALLATLRGHSDSVTSLLLLANGNLASCSKDQTVKIWNLPAIYKYPNRSNWIPVDL